MNTKAQIMYISPTKTSDYVYQVVGKQAIAEIHSIYNKTINLLINNDIFSLQPQNGYVSPISIITNLTQEAFSQLAFSPKQQLQLQLDYQDCDIFCSKLTALFETNSNAFSFYATIAKQILRQSNTQGLALLLKGEPQDLILAAISRYLSQLENSYPQDEKSAVNILLKLIGLGIGLTPSGDDFLCGFMAVFHRFNLTQQPFFQLLAQQIQRHYHHTNPISARFLACALENRFSQTLIHFFSLSENSPVDIEKIKTDFENIGHSSGMDTLFGLYFACRLLNRQKICDPTHICKKLVKSID